MCTKGVAIEVVKTHREEGVSEAYLLCGETDSCNEKQCDEGNLFHE